MQRQYKYSQFVLVHVVIHKEPEQVQQGLVIIGHVQLLKTSILAKNNLLKNMQFLLRSSAFPLYIELVFLWTIKLRKLFRISKCLSIGQMYDFFYSSVIQMPHLIVHKSNPSIVFHIFKITGVTGPGWKPCLFFKSQPFCITDYSNTHITTGKALIHTSISCLILPCGKRDTK